MRRPQASWVGPPPERVGMPHAGVGISRGLPPSLGFGALSPSITTGSPFSGAVAPRGMNVVHPEPPPTFQAPSYGNVGSPMQTSHIAPLIAALMATGAAAPAAGGGGYAAPPPTPRVSAPGSSNPGLSAAFQTATAKAGPTSSLPGAFNTATSQAGPPGSLAAAFASLAQRPSAGGSNYNRAY
jgi:hypothetical protein